MERKKEIAELKTREIWEEEAKKDFRRMLGERIKSFRLLANHEKGYTQEQIYLLLGLKSIHTYINYETGRNEPSVETLIQLSRIFGVSIDQIVGNLHEDEEDLLAPTQEEVEQAIDYAESLEWRAEVMRKEGYDPVIRRYALPKLKKLNKPAHHLVTNKKKK